MSAKFPNPKKQQTLSFKTKNTPQKRTASQKFGHSPDKESRAGPNERIRHIRKDLRQFQPGLYVTGSLSIEDVIDLKEVFDTYDSTKMGVMLPNDLKLLLTQNGFNPNKKTTYEVVAQFDNQQTGGISFLQFMKAMDTKPYRNQTKKEIGAVFRKYDRTNKGYLTLDDLMEINNHIKENLDQQTLKLMLEKADGNNDGKISFEDFYSVMVKNIY